MQKKSLGDSGIQASALVLGSDLFGTKIPPETCFRLLDFFADRGGTVVDTANFYASWVPGFQGGESETVIGQWVKGRGKRSDFVITTKVGFDYPGSPGGLSRGEIERECERSLRRLQTDYIDVFYAHCDDRKTPLEETMEAFDRLVRTGKVRALGASNLSVWRVAEANTTARANGWRGYSLIEQRYTYLRPRHGADFGPQIVISEEMKDYVSEHRLALVGYSILLRGAYTRQDREVPIQYSGPDAEKRLEVLNDVAREVGSDPNQVVIAWMRQSRPTILPIIAGSRAEQLASSIAALDVVLSDEQMSRLDVAGNAVAEQGWLQPT